MYAIDIDGTIAAGGPAGLLDYLREHCRLALLDVPPDITWWEVFELPEVLAYRRQHRTRYKRIRDNVMGSLLVLRACIPMPGAVAQLRLLSQTEAIRYVTIRSDDPGSQQTTCAWLAQAGFPQPETVTFCRSFFHKLAHVMMVPGPHILIDDRWQDLLVALQELEAQAAASPRFQRMLEGARRRLTLVAFGVSSIDEPVLPSGIRVVALPSWEAFDAQSLAESVAHAQGAGNYG